MIIGFIGTQEGMTSRQREFVAQRLRKKQPEWVNHGDCIGSDEYFHNLVKELLPACKIHIYPCNISTKRAYCKADFEFPEKPPLDRNTDIVRDSDEVIACPKEPSEVLRSGTWATIRRAKRAKKPLCIVYPNGSFEHSDDGDVGEWGFFK